MLCHWVPGTYPSFVCSFNWCLRASFTHTSCGAHHFAHSKCKRSHTVTASLSLVNSTYRAILQAYSCHHDGRLPSVLWVCVICMHAYVCVHMISILFNEACSLLELGACLHGLVFRDSQSLLPEWAGNFRRATMTPGNCVGAGDLNLAPLPHSCTASTSSPVSSTQLSRWWTNCLTYVLFTLPIHPLTDSSFVSTSWLLYIKSKGVKWSLQNLIFFLFTYIPTSWTVRSYEILLPIILRYM